MLYDEMLNNMARRMYSYFLNNFDLNDQSQRCYLAT